MIGTVEIDDGKMVTPAEMTTPGAWSWWRCCRGCRHNGVTHCVMEVSSHALHQERVAGIDFAVGIFTNLTGDHLDYHGTMEEYAAAKAMLFEGLGEEAVAVVNADDKWAERMIQNCKAGVVRVSLSGNRRAQWPGEIIEDDFTANAAGNHGAGVVSDAGCDGERCILRWWGGTMRTNILVVAAAARAEGTSDVR